MESSDQNHFRSAAGVVPAGVVAHLKRSAQEEDQGALNCTSESREAVLLEKLATNEVSVTLPQKRMHLESHLGKARGSSLSSVASVRSPNQALEPTAPSVMPRAFFSSSDLNPTELRSPARGTPAGTVAHL